MTLYYGKSVPPWITCGRHLRQYVTSKHLRPFAKRHSVTSHRTGIFGRKVGRFQRKAEVVEEQNASYPKLNFLLGRENYEFPEVNKLQRNVFVN